jgi:hypothetical protein
VICSFVIYVSYFSYIIVQWTYVQIWWIAVRSFEWMEEKSYQNLPWFWLGKYLSHFQSLFRTMGWNLVRNGIAEPASLFIFDSGTGFVPQTGLLIVLFHHSRCCSPHPPAFSNSFCSGKCFYGSLHLFAAADYQRTWGSVFLVLYCTFHDPHRRETLPMVIVAS